MRWRRVVLGEGRRGTGRVLYALVGVWSESDVQFYIGSRG